MISVRNCYKILLIIAFGMSAIAGQTVDVRTDFETRAAGYAEIRSRVGATLTPLSTEATPEEIAAWRAGVLAGVRKERAEAERGMIFTPEAENYIKDTIKAAYTEAELAELRKTLVEAETDGVPVKVHAQYPDSKEKVEMPPKLLEALPQLPEVLQYRFVGKHLLLIDRENGLIVDHMSDAI